MEELGVGVFNFRKWDVFEQILQKRFAKIEHHPYMDKQIKVCQAEEACEFE